MIRCILSQFLLAALVAAPGHARRKDPPPTPLDRYVTEAAARPSEASAASAGSIWMPAARLADGARDLRASQLDDIVTILVVERASAVAKGATKSARSSSAKASVSSLAGPTRVKGPWNNLAGATSDYALDGQGATSRETTLSTTLTARVTRVLPNGYLLVSASKDVQVNSERQEVTVRGVVRPADLGPGNVVRSDRLAELEVRINGKGVVGDAVRRPFILFRLLLGILPF